MDPLTLRIIFQLLFATFLGVIVGLERQYKKKPAGLRTHSLVSLGSVLFTILSVEGFPGAGLAYDPSRIASQIVVGVGFIGAGVIFVHGGGVRGLTTATSVWVASAIGVAVGLKFYIVAAVTAFLAIVILSVLKRFESHIEKSNGE